MKIKEPKIKKEDVLVINDKNFSTENICIVTGCGSGIGRATAIAAGVNGLHVVGIDINEKQGPKAVEMVKAFGGDMTFIKTDLTMDWDVNFAVERASDMGQIKYLANIAGIQHIDSLANFPMERYDFMQDLMLRAPFLLSKLCIPHMTDAGGGVVVNMASVHAHICTKNKPVYNMTKFGLRGLSQSISAEYEETKVRSFTVSTGFVSTPLALDQVAAQAKQRGITPDEVIADVMLGKSRIKEMMTPIEVANLIIFGMSKHGKYIVGGDLLADGGMVLTY